MRKLMLTLIGIFAIVTVVTHTSCTTMQLNVEIEKINACRIEKKTMYSPIVIDIIEFANELIDLYYEGQDGNMYPYHQLPHDISESNVPKEIK